MDIIPVTPEFNSIALGDDALVAALAGGATIEKAAEASGLCDKTVRRRLQDQTFLARLDEFRASVMQAAFNRVTGMMGRAADTLEALLSARSENVRLGAVRTALEFGLRVKEQDGLDARLRALEAAENAPPAIEPDLFKRIKLCREAIEIMDGPGRLDHIHETNGRHAHE